MTTKNLDLTHLSLTEAERHVGHLLRQALMNTPIGAFVLKGSDGSLSFLNAAVFLRRIPTEELIQFLMTVGISEDVVIDLIATLEETSDEEVETGP